MVRATRDLDSLARAPIMPSTTAMKSDSRATATVSLIPSRISGK
jgi:hypothetical protein